VAVPKFVPAVSSVAFHETAPAVQDEETAAPFAYLLYIIGKQFTAVANVPAVCQIIDFIFRFFMKNRLFRAKKR
jgi:hypothetical protein